MILESKSSLESYGGIKTGSAHCSVLAKWFFNFKKSRAEQSAFWSAQVTQLDLFVSFSIKGKRKDLPVYRVVSVSFI